MHYLVQSTLAPKPMTEMTFRKFRDFIQSDLGIKMPGAKKTMLQTRLQKRMRRLGIKSYDEYRDYVFSIHGKEKEMQRMIDVVTTNKTDFFREPKHFDFMVQKAVPDLIHSFGKTAQIHIAVWSAGCSSGEEPYTLAMVLGELAGKYNAFRYSILATDLSKKMIDKAKVGIYSNEDVTPVPMQMKRKYLLRSKDRTKDRVRIIPELRSRVTFRQLNFMAEDFGMKETVDIIFCRNVLIYFKRSDQERIINRLCRQLNPGGFLFVGHSETLGGMDVPLVQVMATVYRKPAYKEPAG